MAAFSSAGMEARSQLSQGVLRLKDNPVLPRFGFPICLSCAQTASCPRCEIQQREVCTRYRHEDASTVMSEPAMSATGHFDPFPPIRLNGLCPFS